MPTISGVVNKEGVTVSGKGFTSSRFEKGKYRITFNERFLQTPAVVASQDWNGEHPDGNTRDGAVPMNISATLTEIKTGDGNGNASDRQFSFIASL